ncbi:hypothetical protein D8674_041181 [Pyrus ussuriensis x Pyrus communis]|uniref:Uncharacterized protein n=1 Tax=Pyrus ussuriensis x Pyrus communis TaxID=2448454 RepID=A0A5N5HBX5_9ROSA|nr:hypothetical protein D8674_041181 [Pyrus ussuriensis x Pyrus communis]
MELSDQNRKYGTKPSSLFSPLSHIPLFEIKGMRSTQNPAHSSRLSLDFLHFEIRAQRSELNPETHSL